MEKISARRFFPFPSGCAFTRDLVCLNSLDFAGWRFLPGMLFKAQEKWWAEGRRAGRHNGLDLRLYETKNAEVRALPEGAKIPLLKAGKIVRIIPDFIGHSIFAEHEEFLFPPGGEKAKKRLFTIYGHVVPEEGIEGRRLDCGSVLGKIAPAKGIVPPHLHISMALVPGNIPLEGLRWEVFDQAEGVAFLDPAEVI